MSQEATIRSPRDGRRRTSPFRAFGLLPLAACAALLLPLLACGRGSDGAPVRYDSLMLPAHRQGPVVSAAVSAGRLMIAYTDREYASLSVAYLPLEGPWEASRAAVETVDRIDWADGLASDFGSLLLSVDGDRENLFYLDREREGAGVLKWASRRAGSDSWQVEVLAPPGRPVAFLPSRDGAAAFFWAESGLHGASLPPLQAGGSARQRISVFSAADRFPAASEGAAAVLSAGGRIGFTAYDADTDSLSYWDWKEGRLDPSPIRGGGRVHAARMEPDGTLAVLLYDPRTRRIGLYEQPRPDGPWRETGVTLADDVSALNLQGGWDGYRFLYAERRSGRQGEPLSVLSLLRRDRQRYVRSVLSSGDVEIRCLSAAEKDDALYVVLLRDGIEVLRVREDGTVSSR